MLNGRFKYFNVCFIAFQYLIACAFIHLYLFVYTRFRSQYERPIWGKFFPQLHEKEDRLYDLGDVEIWAKSLEFLRLVRMEFFQFNRRASLDQLLCKAERKHYSTFSLYTREDFRQAMNGFQARIKNHFSDANNIRWSDENIMLVFQRIGWQA